VNVVSAGALLRDARRRSGLSQTELAERAGVAQSVISTYESDRREPGLHTLRKLIHATGHALRIDLDPLCGQPLGLPDSPLGRRLRRHRRAVVRICDRRGARNVRVFGSVARGEDTATSDIDLLVDLDHTVGLVSLAGLTRELRDVLGVDVDVVPASSLKPVIRRAALAEAIAL
jgi:uncharacterized protein